MLSIEYAGRGADAALEFVADHASAAADVALFDGAGVGGVEGMESVFGLDVESVDVVEIAVPGFGDNGERPPVAFRIGRAVFDLPGDDGIADDPHAVRVGDHDRAIEKAGVFHPGGTGHLAVAVERKPGAENRVAGILATGKNCGHSGADGPFADLESSFAW